MHSLAECPLRTCCRITTTNQYPFHILHLDNSALDLFLTNHLSIDEDSTDCLSLDSLSELRKRTLECLRGKPIADIISPDQDSCPAPSTVTTPRIHGGDTLQPFVIVQSALTENLDNDSDPKSNHAYVISQQQTEKSSTSGFFALDGTAIQEMTSMSVMSYTHPDDIRTLCRVLGQICKSYDTTFRVRWRLQSRSQHNEGDESDESDENDESEIMNPNDPALPIQEGYSRMIEYKGESFEEWVDLTAVFNPTSSLKTQDQDHTAESPKEQFEPGEYIWVEIKGKQSNGQPLLVVRPLTPQETQEQRANTSMLAKLAPNAQDQRQGAEREHDQSNKGMRIRTKRMGLKEGKNLPNWLNVSALTGLAMTPRQDELDVRMPGSFPADMTVSSMKGHTQQSTQLSLPTSACYSRSTGGIINVPSIAYQANAIPPWDLFVNNALDAWKQWILTVHAGQAQFHDWCEYLLETTIDHLIESVSLGLKLLDLENGSSHLQLEEGHEQVATKITAQSNDCHQIQLLPEACERSTDARRQQQQKLSGGIRRVGQILHSYPSIEGVVLTFGNSWLGRKIKSRLEHKLLDSAADQVLEWWYSGEGVDKTSLDTPSKPIDSTNVDSMKSIAVTETL
ncbi:hypothetical protein BGX21_008787 [Mortierella sp. AD011]|nr:hypothetical protein BGX20_008779 [Mortierella sp. AD010]KAF9397517.1 hypothetical protein BGX21_008787 [Mortierella sp. AD011]